MIFERMIDVSKKEIDIFHRIKWFHYNNPPNNDTSKYFISKLILIGLESYVLWDKTDDGMFSTYAFCCELFLFFVKTVLKT